jgi:hypothetical protein
MKKIIALSLLVTLSGCWSTLSWFQDDKRDTELKLVKVNTILDERSRELTGAIQDIADAAVQPPNTPSVDMQVIQMLATEDNRIEGDPIVRVDVKALLTDLDKAKITIQALHEDNTKLLQDRAGYQAHIGYLNEQIGQLQKESSNPIKSLFKWFLGLSTTGIILTVIACIFCPALIPFATRFFGSILCMFPKLVGLLGIVGKNALDSTVAALEEIKDNHRSEDIITTTVKEAPHDTTYSKTEVMDMLAKVKSLQLDKLKATLSKHHDKSTKTVILHRKAALQLETKVA